MESIEQKVKELLQIFLRQDTVRKMISEDGVIKIYRVNYNENYSIVRIDIKEGLT